MRLVRSRKAGSAPTAQCPGTAVNPLAAPGHLCVYESQSSNRGSVVLFTGTTGFTNQASKWGAGVWLIPAAAGNAYSYGTWAVTAANGTSPSRVAPDATGQVAGGQNSPLTAATKRGSRAPAVVARSRARADPSSPPRNTFFREGRRP